MATKKKAKAKSKVKRKKVAVKRPVARKKKPVKVAKKVVAKPKVAKKPAPPPPPGERVGVVTHYYGHLSVAIVKLEAGTLRVGDNIHIKGHTSDFAQRVESLQVEHAPVQQVGPNDDFGLKVREHAREHDVVYKVK